MHICAERESMNPIFIGRHEQPTLASVENVFFSELFICASAGSIKI